MRLTLGCGIVMAGHAQHTGRPVQLTPLTIDGGVTLRCTVARDSVCGSFLALVKGPRGERALPVPAGHPVLLAEIRGEQTRVIDVTGEVEIKVRKRGSTLTVDARLAAGSLWADGYQCTAARWIGLISTWLLGTAVTLEDARALGWEVRKLPICVDWHGLVARPEDATNFVGFRDTGLRFTRGEVATLSAGGKRSPAAWVWYAKSAEIVARRNGDRSIYLARWADAPGYDPAADIERTELRLQGDGLCWTDPETGEVIDLRDPAVLADEAALATVWSAVAQSKRLVVLGRTRNRRAETDPRWLAVQAAAKCPPRRLRQARELRAAACEVSQTARRKRALGAIHRAAGIHGLTLTRPSHVGAFAEGLARLEPDVNTAAGERAIADFKRNQARWGDGPRKGAVMLRERGLLPEGAPTVPLNVVPLAERPGAWTSSNPSPGDGEQIVDRELLPPAANRKAAT